MMININETKSNIGSNGNSRINNGIADLCMRMQIRPTDQLNRMYAIAYMVIQITHNAQEQGLEFVPVEDNDDKEIVIGLMAMLRHAAKYYEGHNENISKASMKLKRFISEAGVKKVSEAAVAADELFNEINKIAPCTVDLENEEAINRIFTDPEYLNQIMIW